MAQERGSSNLPKTSSKSPDDVEQKIISFVSNEMRRSSEEYYDQNVSYEERIHSMKNSDIGDVAEAELSIVDANFSAIINRDVSNLFIARDAVKASADDLKNFKTIHRLNRSARYPESRLMFFAIAAFFLAVETFINGQFFAQGHEMGMVGGFFVAFIPSLINIITGFFLGNFASRLLIHKSLTKRLSGGLMYVVLGISVCAMNLLIAHFRSAMAIEMNSEKAAEIALVSFINAPFNLQNVESWLLLAVGLICVIIATYDFWKMDDPYLGYGDVTRDYEKKLQRYAARNENSLHELYEIKENSLARVENARDSIGDKIAEANSIIEAQARWKMLFQDHKKHLTATCEELLAYYRAINTSARSDNPPSYFDKYSIELENKELEYNQDLRKELAHLYEDSKKFNKLYPDYVSAIAASYKKALDSFPTIKELHTE